MTDTNTTLCTWQITPQRLRATFGRQAIPMTWDFAEADSPVMPPEIFNAASVRFVKYSTTFLRERAERFGKLMQQLEAKNRIIR